jgi:hypothetical protein
MLQAGGVSVITLCAALALSAGVAGAQKPDKKNEQKADQTALLSQQRTQQALVHIVDAAMAGQAVPADFPIQFQNDFLKAQGTAVWVPFTLTMDPAKISGLAAIYFRVTPHGATAPAAAEKNEKRERSREKKGDQKQRLVAEEGPSYPYQQIELLDLKAAGPGQPIRVVRGMALQPGNYDVYVAVRERLAAGNTSTEPALKTSVLKQSLEVPDYSNGEFSTSTVILANRVQHLDAPVPSTEQAERPYSFGQTEIIVSPDHRFRKSQELVALLQIYNPTLSVDKNFNLEATYTFFQEAPAGEKRFNATEPQELTPADAMTASDPAKASIQRAQAIPLESFPEGSYRLEIKVTDKLSSKVVTQSATFSVAP